MQTVKVKEIQSHPGTVKSGKNIGNPYELIVIVGEDGSEFTTFDTAIKEVGEGGVLEIEPEVKNGKTNIKPGYKIVSKGSSPVPVPAAAAKTSPDMSKEDWERKQMVERASFEAQTAFKGVVDMVVAIFSMPDKGLPPELYNVYEHALAWADRHFTNQPPVPVTKPTPSTPVEEKTSGQFKNVGEFLTVMLVKGLTRSKVVEELIRLKIIESEADLPNVDLAIAWEALGDAITPENLPF